MPEQRPFRIVILSNSQGTSAGLAPGTGYPAMLQEMLGARADMHRLLMSGWALRDALAALDDNVLPLKPDLVILQFGIVEATQRILSARAKSFFASIPLGGHVTRLLYHYRSPVLRLRRRLGFSTRLMTPAAFGRLLAQVARKLTDAGIDYRFLHMPLLPDGGASMRHPFVNEDIALFNREMDSFGPISIEARADDWGMQSMQPGTVHFTEAGHRAIAAILHNEALALMHQRTATPSTPLATAMAGLMPESKNA